MTRYLLNIGLTESSIMSDGRLIHPSVAMETARHVAGVVFDGTAVVSAHAVHDSGSEPTLVVEVRTEGPSIGRVALLADALCSRLRQEAIAFARLDAGGGIGLVHLRGPMAARWGDQRVADLDLRFRPEYFLLLNGKRAADPVNSAA